GGRQAAAPLKELGEDPISKKPVVVKDGRFGPYVTDGEFNATLRKDDSVESMDISRAAELLAEKRAKGPAKKKAPAKKTAAKKAPAKKSTAAKTSTAKKTTAKAPAKTAAKSTAAKSTTAKKTTAKSTTAAKKSTTAKPKTP
ncbi:MAG: DNA topoisomerase I, partial [Brevibacterium aurantiacum]|nr:DNA topoisomerase I [Brevibacterium aurantiacum]